MSGTYKVAVVGATGAVGQQMVACLEERNFPVAELDAAGLGALLGQDRDLSWAKRFRWRC